MTPPHPSSGRTSKRPLEWPGSIPQPDLLSVYVTKNQDHVSPPLRQVFQEKVISGCQSQQEGGEATDIRCQMPQPHTNGFSVLKQLPDKSIQNQPPVNRWINEENNAVWGMIQLSLVTSQTCPKGSGEDGMSQAKEIDTVGPWVCVEFQEVGFRESRVEQWFLEVRVGEEWRAVGQRASQLAGRSVQGLYCKTLKPWFVNNALCDS